jgi:hypothetical protein
MDEMNSGRPGFSLVSIMSILLILSCFHSLMRQ